jgi:hypothetical protein
MEYHKMYLRRSILMLISTFAARLAAGESPLACNLKALTASERQRHAELSGKLFAGVSEKQDLADGFAFRLSLEKVSLQDLGEWIDAEKRCCPFFDFQIRLGREGGPLWLSLTGREGVKQVILEEFRG